jgi:hypothetical protein
VVCDIVSELVMLQFTEHQQLKLTLKTWQHDSEERLEVLSKYLEEEQTGLNFTTVHLT